MAMMILEARSGRAGMIALLEAWRDAGDKFTLSVICATAIDGPEYHILLTIGETTAAMTRNEVEWLGNSLIDRSGNLGQLTSDLQHFGRIILSILADAPPGPHGRMH